MYESLHNHTDISDGVQTHLEVLESAEKANYSVVAFTDHDSLPGSKTMKQLREYDGPVDWIIGCEMSSGLPRELGGGPANMFHIVGLFTDPDNKELKEHCIKMVEARTERMEKMVANLNKEGFKITAEDCLRESGGEGVGRPHIVKAILSHPSNRQVIARIRDEMAEAAKDDSKIKKKFEEMMELPEKVHAYTLFLDKEAFYPDVYVDYTYWQDMDSTVDLIRGAGGVAILAHWGTISKKIDYDMLKKFLEEDRLDGVEVISFAYGLNTTESERQLEELVEQTGCLRSVGVDAHEAMHYSTFIEEHPRAQESKGITQKLVEKAGVSLKWSSLET